MEDSSCQERVIVVSAKQFASVDIEAPIRDSKNVDCWSLASLYQAAASQAEEHGNEPAVKVFALLSSIATIHLKPEDQSEPYGPHCVFDGQRTIIPADLRGEQSAVIAELVPAVHNPGLRARLADIVWYNDRQVAVMAEQAIDAYREAVQLVLDRKAEFLDEYRNASNKDGCNMLRRACQIALATGWKEPRASELKTLVSSVIRDAIDRQDYRGFFNTGKIAIQFGIDDPRKIAAEAEKFAESDDVDPHWSHDLWEFAAQAHRQSKNSKDRDRCLVYAAEAYVAIAHAAGGKGMVAASFIMDAIQALRHLPNTRQRRDELEEKLRDAQSSVHDEMGVISTQFNLTELVKHSRKCVGGLTLSQALGNFAILAQSPEPDELWEEARQSAEQNPLSSMMPSTLVDDDGKVITKSPGFFGDADDCDLALHHLIVRNESLRRQTDVQGLIEPARSLIQSEHPIDRYGLRPIVEMTPFVPADRNDLVTTGLMRFFGGDLFSALHILVPQLEHSLRHILKQAGVEPSAIKPNMTQQNRTLSVLLDKERKLLEGLLGAAIVFEIENIFDFNGGPRTPTSTSAWPNDCRTVLLYGLDLCVLVHLQTLLSATVSELAPDRAQGRQGLVHPLSFPNPDGLGVISRQTIPADSPSTGAVDAEYHDT